MIFMDVEGQFNVFAGSVTLEDKKLSALNGSVKIDSIFTDEEDRDENLKSEGYFDVNNFPVMTFKSNKVDNDTISGNLTIKGITKPVTFELSDSDVKLSLVSEVNRKDFNLDGRLSSLIKEKIGIKMKLTFPLGK